MIGNLRKSGDLRNKRALSARRATEQITTTGGADGWAQDKDGAERLEKDTRREKKQPSRQRRDDILLISLF